MNQKYTVTLFSDIYLAKAEVRCKLLMYKKLSYFGYFNFETISFSLSNGEGRGHSREAYKIDYYKYLVFGLKALYILAQWQRPEGTTPWVKLKLLKVWGNKKVLHI